MELAHPRQFYSDLYKSLGSVSTSAAVVIFSARAHPSFWIAARQYKQEVFVLLERSSQHSIEHGKQLACDSFFRDIYKEESRKTAGSQKRLRTSDLQTIGCSVPADVLIDFTDVAPRKESWLPGLDVYPTHFDAVVPKLS